MKYEVTSTRVEPEYAGHWSGAVVLDLVREDGETGDVWIEAGVPPYLTGTAQAAGHTYGLEDVWLYGDSRDTWCPRSFWTDNPDDILAACKTAALEAWHEYQQAVK